MKVLSNRKRWSTFIMVVIVFMLSSCNGGASSSSNSNDTPALPSSKQITSYSINGVAGIINGQNINVVLPASTPPNLNGLVATFTTTGKSVLINDTPQISGSTANNFTNPVTYTVVAADGSKSMYQVTASIAASDAKEILSYSINGVAGIINGQNINVALPASTLPNLNGLVATFTTTGKSVLINDTPQVSGSTANDFTNPVTYTVVALDGSRKNYVVSVIILYAEFSNYNIDSYSGIISPVFSSDEVSTLQTINVSVSYFTYADLSSLPFATFSLTNSDAAAFVNGSLQVSGDSYNDFSHIVQYSVSELNYSSYSKNYNISVNRRGAFLYVFNESGSQLDTNSLNSDGTPDDYKQKLVNKQTYGLALSSYTDTKYLYSSNNNGLSRYGIDIDSGMLQTGVYVVLDNVQYRQLIIDTTGQYLYADSSNGLAGFKINADGSLSSLGIFDNNTASGDRHFTFDSTGNYLYSAEKDLNRIVTYKLNPLTGELSELTDHIIDTGLQPQGISSVTGYVYVTNFADSTISTYRIASDGTLSAAPTISVYDNIKNGYGIATTNKCVFVTGFNNNMVAAFAINDDGSLTFKNSAPTNVNPSDIKVNPVASTIYFTNSGSTSIITSYSYDPSSCSINSSSATDKITVAHPSGLVVW